jgi:chromate transporter
VSASSAAAGVVAQAVLGLGRSLCDDAPTRAIGLAAALLALTAGARPGWQWLPIAFGAAVGAAFLRRSARAIVAGPLPIAVPRAVALASGFVFAIVVLALLVPPPTPVAALLATILRAGALVFGGGHVVLPLLQSLVGAGLIDARDFFAGYGAVQAVPGPLFTFAAFVGAANRSALHGALGALVGTVAIFVPSFALIFALAPVWNALRAAPAAAAALRGANAAVVGLLAAVLVTLVTALARGPVPVAIACAAFALLKFARVPPWAVVGASAALGALVLPRAG